MIAQLLARARPRTRPQATCCFSVSSFPSYGELSGAQRRGTRSQAAASRWPPTSATPPTSCCGSPRTTASPAGDSPWGRGRPRLAHRVLGHVPPAIFGLDFDIHLGGEDLLFPHHENERAQSLSAFPRPRLRASVDAQRDAAGRRPEDCRSRWATSSPSRDVLATHPGEGCSATRCCVRTTGRVLNFTVDGPRGKPPRARPLLPRAEGGRAPRPIADAPPASVLETALRRSQHARSVRGAAPPRRSRDGERRRRGLPAICGPAAPCWDCSVRTRRPGE